MNCRSDAAVQGYTAGGLVGNADNSSVLASIFNGRVSKLEAANAGWEAIRRLRLLLFKMR